MKAGPGRPKGSPNKINADVKEAVEHAFRAIGGQEDLAEWARENRDKFYTLMLTKLLPKDINATVRHVTDAALLSDDELANIAGRSRSDAPATPQDKTGLH